MPAISGKPWRKSARNAMTKNRLEAFSDGVLAIIITIMVLEMKVPHGEDLAALQPLLSVFLSYVLSFIYVGIYCGCCSAPSSLRREYSQPWPAPSVGTSKAICPC